jgi:glycosyltransferase involved in cell wall biosynthesis
LPPFVQALAAHPDWDIEPVQIDASPLPPDLKRFGQTSVKGLRRWNLDWAATRWRLAASRHVRRQLEALHAADPLAAVVVNTQSVGLDLPRWPNTPPIFLALDATLTQLIQTGWFGTGRLSRWLFPLTMRHLLNRERELFRSARGFFPWSETVAKSLRVDYGIPPDRIMVLPPSLAVPAEGPTDQKPPPRRQILFLGGNFHRKGGAMLLDAFRASLGGDFELHIVTQSSIREEPGVVVHQGITAYDARWHQRWQAASVFVFPSTLETFGIVLLEALAYRVPVVSSRAGAAVEILEHGAAGVLLEAVTPQHIATAVRQVFADPVATQKRVDRGFARVREYYELSRNAHRLAAQLRAAVEQTPP